MTPPAPDLARRAVACRGWRWMPGIHLECGDILLWSDDHHWHCAPGGAEAWRAELGLEPAPGDTGDTGDTTNHRRKETP